MGFFSTIKDSLISPAFYKEIPKKSFASALGYFLLITLIVTTLQVVKPAATMLKDGTNQLRDMATQLVNSYPEKLTVNVQGGKVTTNVKEPYYIGNNSGTPKYIVVIDTKTPYTAKQFNDYNTFAWVTKDSVFTRSNSEIKAMDLTNVSDVTINRDLLNSVYQKVEPYFKFFAPTIVSLMFVGMFFANLLRLFYLLFAALLILILGKITGAKLSYGQSYKMGMYALTLPLLVEVVLSFTKFSGFPFMFTLLLLGVVLLNTKLLKK